MHLVFFQNIQIWLSNYHFINILKMYINLLHLKIINIHDKQNYYI